MKPFAQPAYWRLYRGLVVLAAGVALFPLAARGSYAYLLPLGQLCGIYAILVTGLTLLMGFTGQVSLGHAGFYGFGAYAAAIAVTAGGMPLWLAVPVGLVAGGLLAWVTGFAVLRLRGHHLALATLCVGVIVYEFINKLSITGGAAGLYDLPELNLFGWLRGTPVQKFYLIWSVTGAVLLWALHLTASPVGRALQAIHGDEDAAAALGIDVFRVKLKVFVASGVLAAMAGVLYAFVYTPSYLGPEEFGLLFSVTLVTMAVVGGMGSVWGGVAGAVVLTGLHEVITLTGENLHFTDIARCEQLVYGLLLVLLLIFCPRGLMSVLTPRRGRA